MATLVDIPTNSAFFAPADALGAYATLVEPTQFNEQIMTDNGPRNQVIADVTIFANEADIDASEAIVKSQVKIEQTILARDLAGLVGSATVVTLRQLAPRNGNRGAWVFDPAPMKAKQLVVAYLERRDAAEAEAPAGDDVPDYLK